MNGRAVISSPARSNVSTSIFASIIWSLLGLERLAVMPHRSFFLGYPTLIRSLSVSLLSKAHPLAV